MSNIKQFEILAEIPSEFRDKPSEDYKEFCARVGALVLNPLAGINVETWEKEPFSQWLTERMVNKDKSLDDKHDGAVILRISGREAISFRALELMVCTIKKVGKIEKAWAQDVEDVPSVPYDLEC